MTGTIETQPLFPADKVEFLEQNDSLTGVTTIRGRLVLEGAMKIDTLAFATAKIPVEEVVDSLKEDIAYELWHKMYGPLVPLIHQAIVEAGSPGSDPTELVRLTEEIHTLLQRPGVDNGK